MMTGAAIALLNFIPAASAQQRVDPHGQTTFGIVDYGDQTPESLWSESITIHNAGLQRVLGISRGKLGAAQRSASEVQYYFVSPEFSLKPSDAPNSDYGALVHDVDVETISGKTRLWFVFRLHSSDVDRLAKEILSASATETRYRASAKKDAVILRRWPVVELVMVCRRAGDRDPLAISEPMVLSGLGDILEIALPFDTVNLTRFKEAQEQGLLEFTPVFSSAGQCIETLQEDVTVTAEMVARACRGLSSAQLSGTHPVLQQRADSIVRELTTVVQESRRVSNKALFQMVESDTLLVGAVIDRSQTLALKDLYNFPEFTSQVLAENLKPLVDEINRSAGRQMATIRSSEEGEKHAESSGGGFSIVFSAEADTQHAQSLIRRIEAKTGLKFRESTSKLEFVPHEIQMTFLTKGTDRQAVARCRYLQFDVESNRTHVVPAAVPQWFTTELVDSQINDQLRAHAEARASDEQMK